MNAPAPVAAAGRRPPLAAIVAAGVWALYCLAAYSDAGVGMTEFLLGFALAGAWMLAWIVRLGLALWRGTLAQTSLLYWSFEPGMLALFAGLSVSGALSHARFLASEGALTAYVEGVRAGAVAPQDDAAPARRVGLYVVSQTEALDNGAVRFITSGEGLLDKAGFIHAPNGSPPVVGEDSYRPLKGPWRLWRQSW